jgi:hypothetical protein
MKRVLLFLVLTALAGCATNATRESALLLVDQIDEYQKAIDAKVAAEQTYYTQTRNDLQDQARRQALREAQASSFTALTEITDQALIRDRDLQASVLQRYLRSLDETARDADDDRARREAELRALYRVNFKDLSTRRSELAQTRSHLLQLGREKSTTEELTRFLQQSAQRAIELNKEQEQQAGGD